LWKATLVEIEGADHSFKAGKKTLCHCWSMKQRSGWRKYLKVIISPDYQFDKIKKEANGMYETTAPVDLNQWITMRIKVKGQVFLNPLLLLSLTGDAYDNLLFQTRLF
jgi:hypothetical protein